MNGLRFGIRSQTSKVSRMHEISFSYNSHGKYSSLKYHEIEILKWTSRAFQRSHSPMWAIDIESCYYFQKWIYPERNQEVSIDDLQHMIFKSLNWNRIVSMILKVIFLPVMFIITIISIKDLRKKKNSKTTDVSE